MQAPRANQQTPELIRIFNSSLPGSSTSAHQQLHSIERPHASRWPLSCHRARCCVPELLAHSPRSPSALSRPPAPSAIQALLTRPSEVQHQTPPARFRISVITGAREVAGATCCFSILWSGQWVQSRRRGRRLRCKVCYSKFAIEVR